MISSASSLPTIIIFERHWDEKAKAFLKNMMPEFSNEGYDTLCFEINSELSEKDIVSSVENTVKFDSTLNSQAEVFLKNANVKYPCRLSDISFGSLAELMRFYVSSKEYIKVAEKIKYLPANLLVIDTLKYAKKECFDIKGVDIDLTSILNVNRTERMDPIKKNEALRIDTMSTNILKLRTHRKGIIFTSGALHAEGLIKALNEKGLAENVLYYFPYSEKLYDESVNDLSLLQSECPTLINHMYCIDHEIDSKLLGERVIKDIRAKNIVYKEIVQENEQSKKLKSIFSIRFINYMRPGYYVDSLLEITEDCEVEKIMKKCLKNNIQIDIKTFSETKYLVIPDVNTKKVADKIYNLK